MQLSVVCGGRRDKPSAFPCLWPGLWRMSHSYSLREAIQRANLPRGSLSDFRHVSGQWSVINVKRRPYKYGRNWDAAQTTASASFSVVLQLFSALERLLLAYAMTCSWPSYWWDRTAPSPVSQASVATRKSTANLGKANKGAEVRQVFKSSKALWAPGVHLKVDPWICRRSSGAAVREKKGMKRR